MHAAGILSTQAEAHQEDSGVKLSRGEDSAHDVTVKMKVMLSMLHDARI